MPYYRTVLTVEILSDRPLPDPTSLSEAAHDIRDGDCSGRVEATSEQVDGPTMARLLQAQGSEPGFFGLTEAGEESEE